MTGERPKPLKRHDAVLFDMDGVVTDTAVAHASAWKRLFDGYLRQRAEERDEEFRPFDAEKDYRDYVDGKPRYAGVESFLTARGIELPYGNEDDDPEAVTVCGLGNRKNRLFLAWLEEHEVEAFPGTLRLIADLRRLAIKTAVISSSRNANAVLRAADVGRLFDAKVDGARIAALGLPGKPDPAIFNEAASQLGVSPERAVVLEDATAGVEAAVRGHFGLVIGIDRDGDGAALRHAGAQLTIHDASELALGKNGELAVKTTADLASAWDHRDEIRRRLDGQVLAAFLDYDGTLTPIVEDHTKATLSAAMSDALTALGRHCTLAIVSGRDVETLRRLVALESLYYAGSHGFEIKGPEEWSESLERGVDFLPAIDAAGDTLHERLAGIAGHRVERKRFSIAVHYRKAASRDVAEIERIVDDVVAAHGGLKKGHGKKVFRVQPGIDWHKGYAVRWLLERLDLDHRDVVPLYIGDDVTDEDAFRVLAGRGLTVVVRDHEPRPTAADYALQDTNDVRRFLAFLTAVARG